MNLRRPIVLIAAVAIVCGFAIVPASPQATPQQQMVMLHVRVIDPSGKAVSDVPQSSFQITEDGVPQQIEFFSAEKVPLSYGLVIDCSGSLHDHIQKVVDATIRIVNSNTDADETFLVRFISSDKIELLQELTSDKKLLVDGLNSLYIEGGQTAVIDAVYLAAQKLTTVKSDVTKPRRKVLVLITDGDDRASYYKDKQLLQLLHANNAQVYVIGIPVALKPKQIEKATRLLNLVAGETGGRLFVPRSPADLSRIADEVINDIRTQYVIGYVPSKATNDFHKVQVTIADNPNQEKRIAVTRLGYTTKTK